MKITMAVCVCSVFLGSSVYAEGNANKGKKIYEASECVRCHQTNEKFTRENRKVKTLAALNAQVRKCDAQLSTNLFDDEIEDVVAYLNQAHYNFAVNNGMTLDDQQATKNMHKENPK
jgi:mono/diheme cytochrome c family protein